MSRGDIGAAAHQKQAQKSQNQEVTLVHTFHLLFYRFVVTIKYLYFPLRSFRRNSVFTCQAMKARLGGIIEVRTSNGNAEAVVELILTQVS
jgi:hypothetical protein